MAIITAPDARVLDADGNPVSGGKFRVYTANTTTLADLFSDNTLATPRANPVVANAAGELPFFFLASGTYDTAQLDASDVELNSQQDVPAWGEDTGDFNRTVAGLGRIKITGAAGAVQIQAGDPDPDDTGGTLTVEGWEGTQLSSLTLDTASLIAGTSAGALKENSKRLPGVVATSSTALAAATSLVIPLPNEPTGVRGWRVDVFDLFRAAATAITITLRMSFDGGATYKSTNEYHYWSFYRDQATNAVIDVEGTLTTGIPIALNSNGKTDFPMWGMLEILTPLAAGSSDATIVRGEFIGVNQEATPIVTRTISAGYCQGASIGQVTHLQLISSSGNINGNYRVAPMRGFGD
jgi:hypothetical protein